MEKENETRITTVEDLRKFLIERKAINDFEGEDPFVGTYLETIKEAMDGIRNGFKTQLVEYVRGRQDGLDFPETLNNWTDADRMNACIYYELERILMRFGFDE